MKKLARLMAFVMAAVLPMQAFAAFECDTKIKSVLVYADGNVNVLHTGRGDYTVICNLNSNWGAVSPTTCGMWTAVVLGAKKRDAIVQFYFGGQGSCATLGTYGSAATPTYVGEITAP